MKQQIQICVLMLWTFLQCVWFCVITYIYKYLINCLHLSVIFFCMKQKQSGSPKCIQPFSTSGRRTQMFFCLGSNCLPSGISCTTFVIHDNVPKKNKCVMDLLKHEWYSSSAHCLHWRGNNLGSWSFFPLWNDASCPGWPPLFSLDRLWIILCDSQINQILQSGFILCVDQQVRFLVNCNWDFNILILWALPI